MSRAYPYEVEFLLSVLTKDKKLKKLVDELLKQYDRIEKHVGKMGYEK